jgi:hypothetical protein
MAENSYPVARKIVMDGKLTFLSPEETYSNVNFGTKIK